MRWQFLYLGAALLSAGCAAAGSAAAGGERGAEPVVHRVYVANESSDVVSRVAFRPGRGLEVERRTQVGLMIADIDGPHGLAVSPDGRFWYVSLAHGTPFGRVLKYAADADTIAGRVELGHFPASMTTTPDGVFLYVVNFNLYGPMEPSSVSIVYTPTMTEVARPQTCVMPHGSRLNEAGTRHYSVCMMDDHLVEIDTQTLEVSARWSLRPGHEGRLPLEPAAGHGMHHEAAGCSPTWAQPGRGAWSGYVYVPCNAADEVLEVELATGRISRRFATGRGPYNVEVTPDGGTLLTTLKSDQGVSVVDLSTGRERARIATTQPVTHGVVVTDDGRWAFVTNEAVGSTRGTLDVLDLGALRRVASIELDYQPGGIDLVRAP
jgi:DNA-binding beta-propeller fold protein YncE